MIIEPLTKENFWDQLEALNPLEMHRFKEWVNKYKTDHELDKLFNAKIECFEYYSTCGGQTIANRKRSTSVAPKFHDLPFAFQIGIFQQFLMERASCDAGWVRENGTQLIIHYFKDAIMNNPNKIAWKGTPGPWKVNTNQSSRSQFVKITSANNTDVIWVGPKQITQEKKDDPESIESMANAHLISAAPEAVEFIVDLRDFFDFLDLLETNKIDTKPWRDKAKVIIKKAYNL